MTQLESATHHMLSLTDSLHSIVEVNVGIAVACMPTLKLLVRKIFPQLLEATTARHRDELTASTTPNEASKNKHNQNRTLDTALTTFGGGEWDEESLSERRKQSPPDLNDSSGVCKPRPKSIIRWSILSLPPRLTIPTKLSDFSDLSGYIRQDERQAEERERQDRVGDRTKEHLQQQHQQR